jgi:GTPase SAR1 family protein
MINQFIVTIVFQIIDQQETTVAEADSAEVVVDDMVEIEMEDAEQADMVEIAAAEEDLEEIDHHEKCTKQPVEIVETSVKFHSNQVETNQFIVTIASKITNQQETTVDAEDISHFYTNNLLKNY